VHLALVAMAGDLGMELHLNAVPVDEALPDSTVLYSESAGRFIVTVDPKKQQAFEAHFSGMQMGCMGRTTESPFFRVKGRDGDWIMEENVHELKEWWKKPFGHLV
jgi:phosphoribosylformylglycinamidine synthase subunit PurSL